MSIGSTKMIVRSAYYRGEEEAIYVREHAALGHAGIDARVLKAALTRLTNAQNDFARWDKDYQRERAKPLLKIGKLGATVHTEKLHVAERWRMTDGGQMMEATFTVADPDAFYQPWSGMRRYRRVAREITEDICAENNQHLVDYTSRLPTSRISDLATNFGRRQPGRQPQAAVRGRPAGRAAGLARPARRLAPVSGRALSGL
jgi:hypothetical protein